MKLEENRMMNEIINKDCYIGIKSIDISSDDYIIVTDPPFNINYKYNTYKDNLLEEEFYNKLANLIRNKMAVIIMYPEMLHKLSVYLGYAPLRVVSWVYNSNVSKEHRDIAFYNIKPDFSKVKQPYQDPKDKRIAKLIANGSLGTNIYDWWHISQVKNINPDKYNHPCQMPLQVMKNIIELLPSDKIIIDTFSGTGTTLLAAKELDRNYIGFEIDKDYYKICKDRLNYITPNNQTSIFTDFNKIEEKTNGKY
jgi:site-specific DNA-methyltransferase (adenine-specific)